MAMVVKVRDSFTDTAGKTLSLHSPEMGGPWIAAADAPPNYIRISNSNSLEGYFRFAYNDWPDIGPSFVRAKFLATVHPQNKYQLVAIVLRVKAAEMHGLFLQVVSGTNNMELWGNGSCTTFPGKFSPGSVYLIAAIGAVAKAYKDGDLLGQVAIDPAYAVSGKGGVWFDIKYVTVEQVRLDDFRWGKIVGSDYLGAGADPDGAVTWDDVCAIQA